MSNDQKTDQRASNPRPSETHYAKGPEDPSVACGAWGSNEGRTNVIDNVTCKPCRESLERSTRCCRYGPPTHDALCPERGKTAGQVLRDHHSSEADQATVDRLVAENAPKRGASRAIEPRSSDAPADEPEPDLPPGCICDAEFHHSFVLGCPVHDPRGPVRTAPRSNEARCDNPNCDAACAAMHPHIAQRTQEALPDPLDVLISGMSTSDMAESLAKAVRRGDDAEIEAERLRVELAALRTDKAPGVHPADVAQSYADEYDRKAKTADADPSTGDAATFYAHRLAGNTIAAQLRAARMDYATPTLIEELQTMQAHHALVALEEMTKSQSGNDSAESRRLHEARSKRDELFARKIQALLAKHDPCIAKASAKEGA